MTNIIYRPAKMDDLETAYDLYYYEHIESYGNCGVTLEQQRQEWEYPGFELDKHTMYVFTETGRNIAYAELRSYRDIPVRPNLYAYVHPDYRGQGIGSHLTEWAMKAAKQFIPQCPDEARVVLCAYTNMKDGADLLESYQFAETRQSLLMAMDLQDDMPGAQFPDGFYTLTMEEHPVLEDFIRIYHETFRDHRGAVDEPLSAAVKRWESFIDENFPPENFVMVKDGDKDAAILIMADRSDENPDQLWVQTLGTMPDYRKRGLASNLLYYAHQHAINKGKSRLGLSVDGSSLTGANRLYEKVGMSVEMVYHAYELELRPGKELSKQG